MRFLLRRKKNHGGWKTIILGNLLALFCLASVGFVIAEAYYRFVYDSTDSFSYAQTSRDWFRRHYHLNAEGFRDSVDYASKIEPGKRRITFVGDSFLAGHGVKNVEDRFPNLLRRQRPAWEIQVLAKPGYDTGEELDMLAERLKNGYQIDDVVLVYNLNDLSDLIPDWSRAARSIALDQDRRGWWRRNSYVIDMIYDHWKAAHDPYLKSYFDFVIDGYQGPIWEQQQQRLTAFRDLVQAHGGRLSVVIFPFFHGLGPGYRFVPVHRELDQFWAQSNVPCLDLLPIYSDLPSSKLVVNRFDAHPNEWAHALAAKEVERFLLGQMNTNPPAR